jgi:phospholipase C
MGDQPSINHKGMVAFVGQISGHEGIFVGDGVTLTNITPAFSSQSGRFFGHAAQINNQNQIVAYDRLTGSPDLTFIRVWNGGATDSSVQIARGSSFTDYDFDLIYEYQSINNLGQVVFSACPKNSTGTTVLVTTNTSGFNAAFFTGTIVFKPLIADTGRFAVRGGGLTTSSIRLYAYDTRTFTSIANTGLGFTNMGQMPGVSDDGSIVVFAGNRGNGPGVFAAITNAAGTWTTIRVAGENQGPMGPTSELGFDDQGQQQLYLSSFDLDARVAVIRDDLGDPGIKDDNIIVSFTATPNSASGTNGTHTPNGIVFSANKGLWTVRLHAPTSLPSDMAPTNPLPVIQLGDTLQTAMGPKSIDNFSTYKPLAKMGVAAASMQNVRLGDHRLAFWASSGSDQMIVRAAQDTIHVVLVMMENRSFDHIMGWLPNADGRQSGLTYTNSSGQSFSTWPLAPHFQGCGCKDPDHSYDGGRIEFNTNNGSYGACDGWLRANANDTFSIGYYRQNDLSFLGQVAPNWTVCDRYFAAIMAETQPNRIYQHAAQTDSLVDREGLGLLNFVNLPTIWDLLSQNNISAHYYYVGPPITGSVLSLWGPLKYSSISSSIKNFYTDCANGTLPAVSFVDPVLTSVLEALWKGDAGGNDDHPHSDIRNGEEFLASIYNAVVSSPNWSNTVLIINFDEWGGFFDHVAPPVVQIEPAEQALVSPAGLQSDGRLGFRVPCLLISPWARRGYVAHELFDHTSVLKLIENRWRLPALTVRDANANDLADALDFQHPDFTVPSTVTVPAGPFGGPCQSLQMTKQANGTLTINWDQDATCWRLMLQTAPTVLGPWTDLPGAASPYVITPSLGQRHFRFRVIN